MDSLTANTIVVNNTILPTTSNVIDIGSPTMRFGALYLAGNTIDLGGTLITTDPAGQLTFTTESGNIAITANTISFLGTVANSASDVGNVAFDGNINAYAIYSDNYFYANGTSFTGQIGYTGSAGAGYTGSAGAAGATGAVGYTGSRGVDGTIGVDGATGPAGYTGSAGTAGSVGYTGSAGTNGSVGYTGSRGADGTAGGGYLNLLMPGAITAPVTGTARFYPPTNLTVNTVYANLSANPTNGNLTFIIKKNGTSIGTTFTLSSALMNAVSTSISLTTTDYLTVDVTGSAMGSDLHIKLKYS